MGKRSAGFLLCAPTGRCLLLLRSSAVNNAGTWSVPGGQIEDGEAPLDAALSELLEETGYAGPMTVTDEWVYRRQNKTFHNFIASVPEEFTPRLNWEHARYGWYDLGGPLPAPLHHGLVALIGAIAAR